MVMQTVLFRDLGQMDYQEAWDYQTVLHNGLIGRKLEHRHLSPGVFTQEHHLLFVEHPPVYTLGRSGSPEHLLLTEAQLEEKGIRFYKINRGGDITYHGPGQIVGYPILDLDRFFTDVHRYVRCIEEVIIRTLAEYGLEGLRIAGYTGVWLKNGATGHRKVCAIGVHLSRWVTLHGWAFNVNTPLSYFDNIVPCGIKDEDKAVTSLANELGREIDLEEVKDKLKRHFAAVFECRIGETHNAEQPGGAFKQAQP